MSVIEEIRNDTQGLELLADWLGHGGNVVSQMKSLHRASVCVAGANGNGCPENTAPNWWDNVKNMIAETIRKELEIKRKMMVGTPFDDGIHMCKVCGCCLKLKVHVPIEHIYKHTSPATVQRFPPHCWIRKEIEQLQLV